MEIDWQRKKQVLPEQKVKSFWPKRVRNKPIDCSLCGQLTHAANGVCSNCSEIYAMGKRQQALAAELEKQTYVFRQYELALHLGGNKDFYFTDLLEQLTGLPCKLFVSMDAVNKANTEGRFLGKVKLGAGGHVASDNAPYASIELTAAQADIVNKALLFIPQALADERNRGLNEGGRFVTALARGDIGIDDLNHWQGRLGLNWQKEGK